MNERGRPRVLIIGGGIAGLEAALALNAICRSRVAVEMIAPKEAYTYRPLAVAEPFGLAEHHQIYLNTFALSQDVGVHIGVADSVEPDAQRVHCTNGTSYDYDFLLATPGANRKPSLRNAISFADHAGIEAFGHMLRRIEGGEVESVAFTAATTVGWFLPMYELALMTATFAKERGIPVELAVVTPEETPLVSFGPDNSAAVADLLEGAGVRLHAGSRPASFEAHELTLVPAGAVPADEVVAMPELEGPAIPGLPADGSGFIPVDGNCRVAGREREFAAGDATNFPVKQGGIAAQMAHAAVRGIAFALGEFKEAEPFRPTLDGTLLTGESAHHLRQSLVMGTSEGSRHDASSTWLPLAKVTAPYLVDYLAEHSSFPASGAELPG